MPYFGAATRPVARPGAPLPKSSAHSELSDDINRSSRKSRSDQLTKVSCLRLTIKNVPHGRKFRDVVPWFLADGPLLRQMKCQRGFWGSNAEGAGDTRRAQGAIAAPSRAASVTLKSGCSQRV